MSNIIEFPKNNQNKTQTFEEFEETFMNKVKEDADESAEFYWSTLLIDMGESGYDVDINPKQQAAMSILLLETIKSLHYITKGIDHPLQDIAMELFEDELNDE